LGSSLDAEAAVAFLARQYGEGSPTPELLAKLAALDGGEERQTP